MLVLNGQWIVVHGQWLLAVLNGQSLMVSVQCQMVSGYILRSMVDD